MISVKFTGMEFYTFRIVSFIQNVTAYNFNLYKVYARLPHCLYGAYNNEINAKIKISIGSVIITAEDYQLFKFHRKVHSIPRHILSFLEVLAELPN